MIPTSTFGEAEGVYRQFDPVSSTLEPLFGDLMYNNPNEDEVCVSDLYDSVEEMDLDDLFEEISTSESELRLRETNEDNGGLDRTFFNSNRKVHKRPTALPERLQLTDKSKYFSLCDKENDQGLGNQRVCPVQASHSKENSVSTPPLTTSTPRRDSLSKRGKTCMLIAQAPKCTPKRPKIVRKQPKSSAVADFRHWLFHPSMDKMELRVEAKIGVTDQDFVNEWWAELRAGYDDCWSLYTSIAKDQEELKGRFGDVCNYARIAECQYFMLNLHEVFEEYKLYGQDNLASEEFLREVDHTIGGDLASLLYGLFPVQPKDSRETPTLRVTGDILFLETVKVSEPFIGNGYGAVFLETLFRSVSQGGLTVIASPTPLQYELEHYNDLPRGNFKFDVEKVLDFFESIGFKRVPNSEYWMKRA